MSFAERRAFWRYKKIITVQLTDVDGVTYEAVTSDISLGGMCLSCPKSVVTQVLPNGIKTEPGDKVILDIQLNTLNSEIISLKCHVLGALRIAESDFYIRVSFVDLNQKQQDSLQKLLNQ